MKLKQLQEAKYHNAPDKVAIHEVISSGRGDGISHHKAVVQLDKLIKYIEATVAEDDGVLESPAPEAIFALHGWPELEVGKAGYRFGPAMASTDNFEIIVKGKKNH